MNIRLCEPPDKVAWDAYVSNHPKSTNCHLAGWKDVIEQAYKHKGYYLVAEEGTRLVGILPLIQVKSYFFGNQIVSMPFLNYGGALADDREIEKSLIMEAVELGRRLKVSEIELRYIDPVASFSQPNADRPDNLSTKTGKVRMLMELPGSSEILFRSFKAKLRSQINRPIKEGMQVTSGGRELVPDFYRVFCVNMRDLGSPVHSKSLFERIFDNFGQDAKIFTVRYGAQPVAAALVLCFRGVVEVPWASSLRSFNSLSPNMLLYWSLLEFASDSGYRYFDFGRSSPGEGTAKFKEQWGAAPQALHWHSISNRCSASPQSGAVKSGKDGLVASWAIRSWRRLPITIANSIGPMLRKCIPL